MFPWRLRRVSALNFLIAASGLVLAIVLLNPTLPILLTIMNHNITSISGISLGATISISIEAWAKAAR